MSAENGMSSSHNLSRIQCRRIKENHGNGEDEEEEEEERESESNSVVSTPASATPDIGAEFFEDLDERVDELQEDEESV